MNTEDDIDDNSGCKVMKIPHMNLWIMRAENPLLEKAKYNVIPFINYIKQTDIILFPSAIQR